MGPDARRLWTINNLTCLSLQGVVCWKTNILLYYDNTWKTLGDMKNRYVPSVVVSNNRRLLSRKTAVTKVVAFLEETARQVHSNQNTRIRWSAHKHSTFSLALFISTRVVKTLDRLIPLSMYVSNNKLAVYKCGVVSCTI